jgi:thiazole/oxazole-forming peptide maturase SagD family component
MYSPLCGMVTSVGVSRGNRGGERSIIAGAELCGVHILSGQSAPGPGGYHIGGSGFLPYESMIRVYAEAAERYSCVLSDENAATQVEWASWETMKGNGRTVVSPELLEIHGEHPSGPYDPFRRDAPMTWVGCPALGGADVWVPAQLLFLGYRPRRRDGEPWLQVAVTTGSAVHTDPGKAVLAAVYELIQIDAVMGHWYGRSPAVRIVLDDRTRHLAAIIRRYIGAAGELLRFYWLPSADLADFAVACVRRAPTGQIPAVTVGLGADPNLESAMYRALSECLGVRMLAEWSVLRSRIDGVPPRTAKDGYYDLNSNVEFYALDGAETVEARFEGGRSAPAAELPEDLRLTGDELVHSLLARFADTGKTLVGLDITPEDVRRLGFTAVRLWSPDTLSLCLPSAPPEFHPRFAAYGGFAHRDPHPYP